MMIQVNTDNNIHGTDLLTSEISATIEHSLERFKKQITRVEAHVSDESRGKSGQHDHRCMLEARLEGLKPVAVTEHAGTLEQAVLGASEKLYSLLESTLGKLDNRQKNTPRDTLDETITDVDE